MPVSQGQAGQLAQQAEVIPLAELTNRIMATVTASRHREGGGGTRQRGCSIETQQGRLLWLNLSAPRAGWWLLNMHAWYYR